MQDMISAVSFPSFHLNIISQVITLFIYVIDTGLKQSKIHASEIKIRAESEAKQSNHSN